MANEITYHRDFRGQPVRAQFWNTEVPGPEAEFAMRLVERFGLIAGKAEGEDSAGRSKTTNLSVEETVARAFDLSEATYRTIRERGLMVEILPYEEALEKAREQDGRN